MKVRSFAVIASILLMASACSQSSTPSGGEDTGGGGTPISATLADFSISVDPNSASAGKITFSINNTGPSLHEFVVFKTDLAEDTLPLSDDGTVNEEGEGVTHITEKEDIEVGSTEKLTAELQAGNYVLICNLPDPSGHYKAGMRTSFTVS